MATVEGNHHVVPTLSAWAKASFCGTWVFKATAMQKSSVFQGKDVFITFALVSCYANHSKEEKSTPFQPAQN